MIAGLSCLPSVRLRHANAPLLEERERFLQHLSKNGRSRTSIRMAAAYLIHIVRIMELTELRSVSIDEIREAGQAWASYVGPDRRCQIQGSADGFIRTARQWLAYSGSLPLPHPPFSEQLNQFAEAMRTVRGLAPATIRGYSTKVAAFLKWLSPKHSTLDSVRLSDVFEYLANGRSTGKAPAFIASQCQSLRSFFGYAESVGWCTPGIKLGIRSPRLPRYQGPPRGPPWAAVRKLIALRTDTTPAKLRARAILLLLAIYGLRSSEVAQLRLADFDWRNETFMVRRAKRAGIQHFPLQYEVGEALIRYLQHGRPKCTCRHVFVSFRAPQHPFGLDGLWRLVSSRLSQLGIELANTGPHSLRHACATRLLRQGSSLQEIADFLGHRNINAVGIYARYDTCLLRKVASFSLAGVR